MLRRIVPLLLFCLLATTGMVACGGDDAAVSTADTGSTGTESTEDESTEGESTEGESTEDESTEDESTEAGEELTDVHLTLEWVLQTEFAGYYVAREKGWYAEEGIDLTIQPGGPDLNPVQLLIAGDTDIAINSFANMLVARESGADVISIGQVFERTAFRLISFTDKGVESPADWEGRTVGLWGGFNPSVLATAGKYGLVADEDFTIFNQGFDMEALFSESVDLASAMTYNEYAQALAGADGRELALFDPNAEGTATLENALIVTREWADANPDLAEGFIRATMRGWLHCRDNVEECVDIVLSQGTALPYNFQYWQMNETNKLIWPSTNGLLLLTEDMFTQTADILVEYGVIDEPAETDSYDMSHWERASASLADEDLFGSSWEPLELDPDELFAAE